MKIYTEDQRQFALDLQGFIRNAGLSLSVHDRPSDLNQIYYSQLKVHYSKGTMIIPFDDEYEDAKCGNLLACFNLALLECQEFNEADDYLVWAKDKGHDASSPLIRQIYFTLRDVAPTLLSLTNNARPAYRFDFEFNNGTAQAIRDLSLS